MSESIKPALTAEEWGKLESPDDSLYIVDGTLMQDTGERDQSFKNRHGLAALALYGQPFGFSHKDLARLRQMSFSTFSRSEAEDHQLWWQSFLDRIAALLPEAPTVVITDAWFERNDA